MPLKGVWPGARPPPRPYTAPKWPHSVKGDGVTAGMTVLVLVWGTAFAAIRAVLVELTPMQLTWYRYLPFILLFGAWLVLRRRDRFRLLTRKDWGMYVVVGLLGVFGYHIPLYYGMQDGGPLPGPGATAGIAAILVATTPLWTLSFSVVMGREHFDRRRLLGSLVAFAGVTVVVLLGSGDVELDLAKKAAVVLLAPILWSMYSILGKPLVDRHGSLFFAGLSMCLGTLFMVPYGIWLGFRPLQDFTPALWGAIVYISLAATVGGYAIWNFALKRRRPSEVTAWIYLIPVVATIASWVFLREPVTLWFVVGSALVLLGVREINRARMAPTPAAAPEPVPERP